MLIIYISLSQEQAAVASELSQMAECLSKPPWNHGEHTVFLCSLLMRGLTTRAEQLKERQQQMCTSSHRVSWKLQRSLLLFAEWYSQDKVHWMVSFPKYLYFVYFLLSHPLPSSPLHSPLLPSSPLHSTLSSPLHSPPLPPLPSTPLCSPPLPFTPLLSPLLSSPLHSAPLPSSPLHSPLLPSSPLHSPPLPSPFLSPPLCSPSSLTNTIPQPLSYLMQVSSLSAHLPLPVSVVPTCNSPPLLQAAREKTGVATLGLSSILVVWPLPTAQNMMMLLTTTE